MLSKNLRHAGEFDSPSLIPKVHWEQKVEDSRSL